VAVISKDLKDRLSKIDQIRADLKTAEESATKDIMNLLKDLMRSNPMLAAVRWEQWIPGFNDGDSCEFTIGDLKVKFSDDLVNKENSKDEEDDNSNEEFLDTDYQVEEFFKRQINILNHKEMTQLKKSVNIANEVFAKLTYMEDQLESMFGSNMQITVTAEGVETEDYDCGY
jgi:hypothetical protein